MHDEHFSGTAPSGRFEDFHAVAPGVRRRPCRTTPSRGWPRQDGTTDAVAWVPVADIESGALPVLDLVRQAIG